MTVKTYPIRWSPTTGSLTLGGVYRIEKTDTREYVVSTSGIRLGTRFPTLKKAKARAQRTEDHYQGTIVPEIESAESK